jgi:hypothetical protein
VHWVIAQFLLHRFKKELGLEDDAARWFGCERPSPFMLYTYQVRTDSLAAVTHVNGTARIQTVSSTSNRNLYDLLVAFKARTGYGVLCNTSLNFSGRGFINKMTDLSEYAVERGLDGFVVGPRSYFLRASKAYQEYLQYAKALLLLRHRITGGRFEFLQRNNRAQTTIARLGFLQPENFDPGHFCCSNIRHKEKQAGVKSS